MKQETDLFILTALGEENRAVQNCLDAPEPIDPPFSRGVFINEGGQEVVVVFAQSSDSGNTRAGTLTTRAIDEFHPKRVVLTGIAAGFPESRVAYGDVLVPQVIAPYEKAKLTRPDGVPKTDYRDHVYRVTAVDLLGLAKQTSDYERPWFARIKEQRPASAERQIPDVHVRGVLGSGEKIVADVLAECRRRLIEDYRGDALGLEMESAGAAEAALFGMVPFAAIKAVQDYGGQDKDDPHAKDRWRLYAAEAGAVLTFYLLRRWNPAGLAIVAGEALAGGRRGAEAWIYRHANSDFRAKLETGHRSLPTLRDESLLALADRNIKDGYKPLTTLSNGIYLRTEHYLLPLLQARILGEAELRRRLRCPFSAKYLSMLRQELIGLVDEQWDPIVREAARDAEENAARTLGEMASYKYKEIENQREVYLRRTPSKEGGRLFRVIDLLLQKAEASVALGAE